MSGYAAVTTRPCTKCGIRPRHMFPSGQASRCIECLRVQQNTYKSRERVDRAVSAQPPPRLRAAQEPCFKCGARPRHTYPNGTTISLCRECYNEKHKLQKRLKDAAKRQARVQTEEAGVAVVAAPVPAPTKIEVETLPDGTSQTVFGLLSDMLLLMDRSRPAVRDGAIDGLRLELTLQGVRLGMDTAAANMFVKKESV